ncbi:Thymidine kinase 2, mitochondrial [Lamellibrachia satsuma]|nr:Thymidine kinase 2, mitochondrial [Lamellibrachia satsuma]
MECPKSHNSFCLQVAVEGNIGSGKSSFLHYFDTSSSVEVVPEPVELWKSVRGHNTLELMYKDSERWSLTFQSYVQLTMLQVHTQKQTCPVKMIERSLHSARYCFVENLFKRWVEEILTISVKSHGHRRLEEAPV